VILNLPFPCISRQQHFLCTPPYPQQKPLCRLKTAKSLPCLPWALGSTVLASPLAIASEGQTPAWVAQWGPS
jgi:hypothetical protein